VVFIDDEQEQKKQLSEPSAICLPLVLGTSSFKGHFGELIAKEEIHCQLYVGMLFVGHRRQYLPSLPPWFSIFLTLYRSTWGVWLITLGVCILSTDCQKVDLKEWEWSPSPILGLLLWRDDVRQDLVASLLNFWRHNLPFATTTEVRSGSRSKKLLPWLWWGF